jgi:hypothetical protein
MSTTSRGTPITFTPGNEPYLGRPLLQQFDQLITATLEGNTVRAAASHDGGLTDHQQMACQVIAQAVSIALSIRELIRQGYLFGGHVLLRALVERATLLFYLNLYPEKIDLWKRGWHLKDGAPSLSKMLDAIAARQLHSAAFGGTQIKGSDLTASMNNLLHGKPDSAGWNTVPLAGSRLGHAVSKILNRPELCDDLCVNTIPWLAVITGMMTAYFPLDSDELPS